MDDRLGSKAEKLAASICVPVAFESGPPTSALRYRSPHHTVAFTNQASRLQAILHPTKVLARVLGISVENASAVKLVAPVGDLNGEQANWQSESRRRWLSVIDGAI